MAPADCFSPTEHGERPSTSADQDRWAEKRAPEKRQDQILSLESVAWLQSLPPNVTPHELARRYPRICNRMVERWKYPDLMIHFFDHLLIDNRGTRRGFPMTIALEIAGLQEHYQVTASATKDDVWNRVIASRIF